MMIPEAVIMKQCKESKEKMNDVYKGVVKWVVDKFEDKVEEFKEFKKIALLEVGESDTLQFEQWLLSFGSNVEILKPKKLRAKFKSEAQKMSSMYK